jgi:hypothetical protein
MYNIFFLFAFDLSVGTVNARSKVKFTVAALLKENMMRVERNVDLFKIT